MRATTINPGPTVITDNSPDAVEYVCIAADLLQEMYSKLCALAANDFGLVHALSISESVTRHRLWTLHETARLLASDPDHEIDIDLMRRATSLISWLWAEIDGLAFYATEDETDAEVNTSVLH